MNLMFTGYPPWGKTLHRCMGNIDKTYLFTNEHLTFHIGSDKFRTKDPLWSMNMALSKLIRNDK